MGLGKLDSDPVLMRFLESIQGALSLNLAAIGILEQDVAQIYAQHGRPTAIPRPLSMAAYVHAKGKPVIVDDLRLNPDLKESPLLTGGIVFLAGWPLFAPNNQYVGCLVLGHGSIRVISREEHRIIESFARTAEALLQGRALVKTYDQLRPGDGEDALLRQTAARSKRILATLGIADPSVDLLPSAEMRWSDYDPALARILSRKGTLPILQQLKEHQMLRFNQLLHSVPGMNSRTLTNRLQELHRMGIIERRQYEEVPPRVEYTLAPGATSLVETVIALLRRTVE